MKNLLRMIKNFFRKKPKVISHGEHPSQKLKAPFRPHWGIIVPHTKKSGGAVSPWRKVNEYHYAILMLINMLTPMATRDKGGVSGAADILYKKGCNASLEPHKNAFNRKAKGFEILVMKGDKLSLHYAILFAEAFKAKFPDRILRHGNGVKIVSKRDRGYNNLKATKRSGMDIALLSESFFIDNKDEWIDPTVMSDFWKENLV